MAGAPGIVLASGGRSGGGCAKENSEHQDRKTHDRPPAMQRSQTKAGAERLVRRIRAVARPTEERFQATSPVNGAGARAKDRRPPALVSWPARLLTFGNNWGTMFSLRSNGRLGMVRIFLEEAFALASLTLFLASVAVWVQVLGVAM